MSRSLLLTLLFLAFFSACAPVALNMNGPESRRTDGNNNRSVHALSDTTGSVLPDSLATSKPLSLMDLPQTEEGEIVLSEGYYEADFKSYCLQPGTPSPSDHDAYRQGPLTTHRKDIVETILRNSLNKPQLEQQNIQLLLWSVVSGSDFRKLSWEVQATAGELLTRKQIFQLKGGVVGIVKTVSASLPESGATREMKNLFEAGTSSYELFERIAVLRPSTANRPVEALKDQWYKQPEGYYLRYFPNGYQHVKVQVYVPAGTTASANVTDYLLFDPINLMAIPTHSNSQRLGIGAPAIEVLRKIIQIRKDLPAPKKPEVKVKNPKEIAN